jgi:hypothetical protein
MDNSEALSELYDINIYRKSPSGLLVSALAIRHKVRGSAGSNPPEAMDF